MNNLHDDAAIYGLITARQYLDKYEAGMVAMAMDLDTVVGEVEEVGHKMAKRLGMMPSATGQYPESVFELAVERLA